MDVVVNTCRMTVSICPAYAGALVPSWQVGVGHDFGKQRVKASRYPSA